MKAKTILSLIIVAIIWGCTQKKTEEFTILGLGTDYGLIPTKLNGKVKEVKELNYWAVDKDGKITKGELMSKKDLDSVGSTKNLKAYFNPDGILTRYEVLNRQDVLQTRIASMENGKYLRWDYKLGDSTIFYGIPKYDEQGFFVGGTGYRPKVDTAVNSQVLTHDGKGNYTKFEYFNSKNIKTGYNVISLDEKGNITESRYYDRYDTLRITMINSYDENGNIIRQETTTDKPDSKTVWEIKLLKFDEKNNWIESLSDIDNGKYKIFSERIYVYY